MGLILKESEISEIQNKLVKDLWRSYVSTNFGTVWSTSPPPEN